MCYIHKSRLRIYNLFWVRPSTAHFCCDGSKWFYRLLEYVLFYSLFWYSASFSCFLRKSVVSGLKWPQTTSNNLKIKNQTCLVHFWRNFRVGHWNRYFQNFYWFLPERGTKNLAGQTLLRFIYTDKDMLKFQFFNKFQQKISKM